MADARKISEVSRPGVEMVGFIVIGFFSDGGHSNAARLDKEAKIVRTLLPEYVAEIIRADYVTDRIVNRVIDERFNFGPEAS